MPRRKSCSSPRAATVRNKPATNTSPCHSLSRGTPFRPFDTAESTPSKPTAIFRGLARASLPASKPSLNSSVPRLKFRVKPKPPYCPSAWARTLAPPFNFVGQLHFAIVILSEATDFSLRRCRSTQIARCPAFIEGKSRENQQQANRGAAGPIQPDVYGQCQRTCHEQARDPGVAPATVGARQIGLGLAHSKERDDGEGIKDPRGKNKKIGQLFERSRQRHQTCQHALEKQRPSGRAEVRMDSFCNSKEKSVARHRVAHARSAQHRRIHRAQGGDDHGKRDPGSGGGPFDVFHYIGSDVPRGRHAFERQHFQTSRAEQQIDDGDKSDSADQRAREILLRVFHFGADQIQVFPPVIGPQGGGQRRKKRAENRATTRSRGRPEGFPPRPPACSPAKKPPRQPGPPRR